MMRALVSLALAVAAWALVSCNGSEPADTNSGTDEPLPPCASTMNTTPSAVEEGGSLPAQDVPVGTIPGDHALLWRVRLLDGSGGYGWCSLDGTDLVCSLPCCGEVWSPPGLPAEAMGFCLGECPDEEGPFHTVRLGGPFSDFAASVIIGRVDTNGDVVGGGCKSWDATPEDAAFIPTFRLFLSVDTPSDTLEAGVHCYFNFGITTPVYVKSGYFTEMEQQYEFRSWDSPSYVVFYKDSPVDDILMVPLNIVSESFVGMWRGDDGYIQVPPAYYAG